MSDNIRLSVIKVIANQLSVDPAKISSGSKLVDDLGADSLDIVECTMAIEDTFGITIPDDEAEHLATVDDLVRCIGRLQALTVN